jgi:S-adenosylmethionine hydrolase
MARPITFLSDYPVGDPFVGIVHAVLARGCPGARVIDLAHGLPRHAVGPAALVLARALPYAPPGVHLAVVDPGVGGARRGVALRCAEEERLLVGPDNGLLVPAAERFGGVAEAIDVSASPWRLPAVAATFHGRDVFAPVAARLAGGAPLAEAGTPVAPATLARAPLTRPVRDAGALVAHVVLVDGYGNVELDATATDLGLPAGSAVAVAGAAATVGRTFGDVAPGALLVHEDSSGSLALAVNTGSAAAALALAPGDAVRLEPL